MKSRYNVTRKVLIFWCLFIGVGALFGGSCMLIDTSGSIMGMKDILPYFQVLPFADILFQNFLFSGIALIIVNGITNIIASILLFQKKKLGIILGGIFGITLMMWITIQFVIFPMNFMSTIYFIFGIMQALTGYMCYIFYKQEKFNVDIKEYKNINKDSDTLVIYFSRMGYTKKIAYEYANQYEANVLELKALEKTDGTLGFWWCGRFGMHMWPMKIEDIKIDITKYKKIVIATPIWVFGMSAPIREFCKKYSGKLNDVEYIFVHFMNAKFERVALEMDELLKAKRTRVINICSRVGKIKYKKEY